MQKEEFRNQFQLPTNFSEPVYFTDNNLGFSTIKSYQNGYASLFKIYIKGSPILGVDKVREIEATVTYGKKSEDGIIISSSSEKIKGISDPIDLISSNEFSFNLETKKFFYKNKEINANEVIKILDNKHIKTTKPWKSIWLKTKILWFRYFLTGILGVIFKLLAGLHYLATEEKINIFHNLKESSNSSKPTIRHQLNVKNSELIDLWGYKVRPSIAALYSAFHISTYLVCYKYNYRPELLINIFKNNFLTLMYGIVTLGLANTIIPVVFEPINLKKPLMFVQDTYMKATFRKIKI